MEDKERISSILFSLGKLWLEYPSMRLGQLLTNFAFDDEEAVFYQDDKDVLKRVTKWINKKI